MIPRFDDNTKYLSTDWLYDDFDKICKEFEKMQEQKIFKELQDNKSIEDAVLIMNPKHKDIVIKSGLKCCILWSSLCPENTTYMVTDKQLKENLKKNLERNYKQCCDEKCSLKAESEDDNGSSK